MNNNTKCEENSYEKVKEQILTINDRLQEDQGIETYYPTADEIESWKEVTMPVWDIYLEGEPRAKELIEEARRLLEKGGV